MANLCLFRLKVLEVFFYVFDEEQAIKLAKQVYILADREAGFSWVWRANFSVVSIHYMAQNQPLGM